MTSSSEVEGRLQPGPLGLNEDWPACSCISCTSSSGLENTPISLSLAFLPLELLMLP